MNWWNLFNEAATISIMQHPRDAIPGECNAYLNFGIHFQLISLRSARIAEEIESGTVDCMNGDCS
jgi:hypothetical protein